MKHILILVDTKKRKRIRKKEDYYLLSLLNAKHTRTKEEEAQPEEEEKSMGKGREGAETERRGKALYPSPLFFLLCS